MTGPADPSGRDAIDPVREGSRDTGRAGRWRLLVGALVGGGLLAAVAAQQFRERIVRPAIVAVEEVRDGDRNRSVVTAEVVERRLSESSIPGAFELACTSDVRAVLAEPGRLWLATAGGLLEVDPAGGRILSRVGALNGLPESRLTAIARFRGDLWAGTASSGLIQILQQRVLQWRFPEPAANRITSLLASGGRLYAGTAGGGLLWTDGSTIRKVLPEGPGTGLDQVSALAPFRTGIAAGTREGLFLLEGDRPVPIEAPLRLVTCLLPLGDGLLAGTPYGLHHLDARLRPATWAEDIHVTALAIAGGRILAGTHDGTIHRIAPRGGVETGRRASGVPELDPHPERPATPAVASSIGAHSGAAVQTMAPLEDGVAVGTSAGARLLRPGSATALELGGGLARAHVSALALDGTGDLWLGYFDGGVARLDSSRRLRAVPGLESSSGVNHLAWDPARSRMVVSTMRGVTRHDGTRVTGRISRAEGLAGENVSFAASTPEGWVYCTEQGLTLDAAGGMMSFGAFHGLPSNHVYCAAYQGKTLVAGTLGGLAFLESRRVARRITASPRGLPANWITCLAPLQDGWLVGTYGGGITRLAADGSFEPLTPALEINLNAWCWLPGGDLAAGTLDRGIVRVRPDGSSVRFLREGLGHADVTALAASDRFLFAATEGGVTALPLEAVIP